jgi:hypothetical protein
MSASTAISIATAVILAFVIYLFPSFVAYYRGHPNQNAITVLNFFLGWTFLGWVAALVWASTSIERPPAEG